MGNLQRFPDSKAEAPDATPRGWMWPLLAIMNRADARRACMPGVHGIVNARSPGIY